jgi:hypothetical protein
MFPPHVVSLPIDVHNCRGCEPRFFSSEVI